MNINLEKIDKIVFTDKEYAYISNWVKEQNFDSIDLPLHEALLIMNDIKHDQFNFTANAGIHFRIDEETYNIIVTQYDMSDMTPMVTGTITDQFFKDGTILVETKDRWRRMMGEEYLQKVCKIAVLIVMDVFQYMTNCTENVSVEKISRSVKKKPSKKSKTQKLRYTKIRTTKYTFNTDENREKRDYTFSTASWTVRGHWRYYKKTGKRVWINGYTKGDGEIEGKVYKI